MTSGLEPRHTQFPVRHAHLAVRHAHLARSRPSEGTNSRDVFAERVEVCVSPRTPVRCSPTGIGRRVATTRTAQPASRRTHYQATLAETVVRDDQLGLGQRSRMRARNSTTSKYVSRKNRIVTSVLRPRTDDSSFHSMMVCGAHRRVVTVCRTPAEYRFALPQPDFNRADTRRRARS